MISAGNFFTFSTTRTGSLAERALIKRNFEALSMLYAMGPQLTLTDIILDGANENNASAALGGIALVSDKAELVIRQGAVLRNSRSTLSGGAVHVASGGTLTMTGGEIIGNSAAYGGAVYVAPNASMTMAGGEIISNTASGNGGAVYVDYLDANNRGTMTLTGGTINGNTALNGAGVYLTEGSRMYLSGNPYFGGTGVENENLVVRYANGSVAGNFANWGYTNEAKNGGKTYTNVRQDIFLADVNGNTNSTDNPLRTLVLNGALTDPDNSANVMPAGSIWVWADGNVPEPGDYYHYPSKHQFALFADNVRTELGNRVESTLHAFRNARDDEAAQNNTSEYLYGAVDVPDTEHFNYIYWNGTSGSRKVILRKVRSLSYEPVTGPTFTIYSGNGTTPYKVKNDDGTTTELKDLPSLSSGVFWIGVLPYGDYTIRESNGESFTLHVGDDTADASGVTIAPGSRDGVVIKGPN